MKENTNFPLSLEKISNDLTHLRKEHEFLREEQKLLRQNIEKITEALSRIAIIEERQSTNSTAISRFAEVMKEMEGRIRKLEIQNSLFQKTSNFVDRIIWVIVSSLATYILTKESFSIH